MANCHTITKTLQAEGLPIELVNASREGYFYFVYDADGVYETHSVYVCRFSHLSEGNFRTFEGAYDKAYRIAADRTKEA